MPPVFKMDKCVFCGICIEDCPGYILVMIDEGPLVKYPEECWHCGNCRISCPAECIEIKFPLTMLV